jgi:hypothetical protein
MGHMLWLWCRMGASGHVGREVEVCIVRGLLYVGDGRGKGCKG